MNTFNKDTKPEEITVNAVAENVAEYLDHYYGSLPIDRVYKNLSIFDWWPEKLNRTHLTQMLSFLKTAISMGYTGYVCFKVGASGCANGMWAYKELSKDGCSPDGDFLYRSFTPDYTCWEAKVDDKFFPEAAGLKYDSCKRAKDLQALLAA